MPRGLVGVAVRRTFFIYSSTCRRAEHVEQPSANLKHLECLVTEDYKSLDTAKYLIVLF